MAYTFEILIFIIGIIYGYRKPGKEDSSALLKKGVVIGIILGAIMVVLGLLSGSRGILLLGSLAGAVVFIEVIILAVLFIVGTYIGDMLERK